MIFEIRFLTRMWRVRNDKEIMVKIKKTLDIHSKLSTPNYIITYFFCKLFLNWLYPQKTPNPPLTLEYIKVGSEKGSPLE